MGGLTFLLSLVSMFGALVNLNGPGNYLHIGFVQISYGNLSVIIILIILFVLAVLVPFPHRKGGDPR